MAVKWIGSPNYSEQRSKIDRIVIHWMAGNLKATDSVFKKFGSTSAHYGIENNIVHQYVKLDNTAYHAGEWSMNLRSVGIEHSAAPGRDASKSTIDTSAKIVADLCKKYSIPCDRDHIIKHSQVVPTQCPGTIPIDTIIKKANTILEEEQVRKATKWEVRNAYRAILGREATPDEEKKRTGKPYEDVVHELITYVLKNKTTYQIYRAKVATGSKAAPSEFTEYKPPVLYVRQVKK